MERGTCTFHLGDEAYELQAGDSAVVPTGTWHQLDAGAEGVTLTVTMLAGTHIVFEGGRDLVPPWLS